MKPDTDNDGEYSHDELDLDTRKDSVRNGKGKDDGKEGKEKRSTINRVNRACNNCRRMKMRCVGADEPPCKRCRNSGLECIMEKPGKSTSGGDSGVGEDRIRSLESQVSSIQSTLSDLVTTLRAGISSGASNASGHTPAGVATTTPDHAPPMGGIHIPGTVSGLVLNSSVSPSVPSGTVDPAAHFRHPPVGTPATNYMGPPTSSGFIHSQHSTDPFRPYTSNTRVQPIGLTHTAQNSDTSAPPHFPDAFEEASWQHDVSAIPSNNPRWRASAPHRNDGPKHPTRHMSLPPSRAGSMGPPDIFGPEEIINPLGEMSNMAGLVEAAVERAREEQAAQSTGKAPTPGDPGSGKRGAADMERDQSSDDKEGLSKKTRFASPPPESPPPLGPTVIETQNLPPRAIVPGLWPIPRRLHQHAYPDVVTAGYVSEEEGKELMQIFYTGSSNFIPCYDPAVDTWESLRIRSPFSITAIVWVGARVRDGGGPHSEIQKACLAHAERIAKGTLFHPVHRVEAVQSMVLLSAFQDNGWLPGGHAVRMAVDMGINRSFIHLLRSGMGQGKSKEELEQERTLVVHSRVWFGLYLMEHQMAYGTGRPAIIREDEAIHQCRRLLDHPLSIPSDARLVSTVELTALRSPLHIELTAAPDLPIAESTLRRLKQANQDFDAWERYWDRILTDRFGKCKGDFFRDSLVIQRQYAELFVNSQLLRGIKEPSDVVGMPEEKRTLAIRAMRNAQKCLDICLHSENYRNGLRYAVHYTHVCAAFAASFLIRIARLFPYELNLKKTAKDIEELASVLSDIPAGRYARSLRLILRKARRQKVIPAPSVISSPNRLTVPLPGGHSGKSGDAPGPSGITTFSPSQLVNPSFYLATSPATSVAPGTNVNSAAPNSSMLLNAANQIIGDSPSSVELFEFDSLFAHETMEKAGIPLGENDQLPLFLDGQSLGGSAAPTDTAPYVGLEQFFIPQDVDNRLVDPSLRTEDQQGQGGSMPMDVWW
ncbi:Hypothetical protein CGB_B4500C [Cryptococcus gattii WM276]|uniref:Zn(2)-C6 fungal-type domain-containing protein n=2 Tax=Cryptococcus gattii TaxID=37769 RepID=E6R0T0_CRYGW|nr:Hypothetical protein CGB_B4500C [Cryptococcus gattii WM276]ADV20422.1 Hypothetical protein CGB_B4500C [Cryptococcus gattii WM276]KIR77021.1 hypothetical protein I306_05958 [Cryptococcus gattii EJB2]